MPPCVLSQPPQQAPDGQLQLHASTVVIKDRAVALVGPSGSGKSGMALRLIAGGATLLADDITRLSVRDETLIADCPDRIKGQIEARGVGLLRAPAADPTPLHLVVDLGTPEPSRLPQAKSVTLLGHDIPLLHRYDTPYFTDAIAHYMIYGPYPLTRE